MEQQTYTVLDVLRAEYNLEPLRCLKCGMVGEVTFLQYIGDGICGYCGEWQLEED